MRNERSYICIIALEPTHQHPCEMTQRLGLACLTDLYRHLDHSEYSGASQPPALADRAEIG